MDLAIIVIIGAVAGSFLTALTWRFDRPLTMITGRSVCPHCSHRLAAAELVPLISFIWQKGRCQSCQAAISWRYPIIEGLTIAVMLILYWQWGLTFDFVLAGLIALGLLALFIVDAEHQLVSDLFVIMTAVAIFLGHWRWGGDFWSWVLGALFGALFFFIQYIVSSGRWVGGGDIRLGALLGLLVGWPLMLVTVFGAYVIGALVTLPWLLQGRLSRTSAVPFGPFLIIAAAATLLWGPAIINWYVSIL